MFSNRENESYGMFFIRWLARILSLAFSFLLILFFLSEGIRLSDIAALELIGLLFFPIGLFIGFVISWQNELTGGIVSVLSTLSFYIGYGLLTTGIPDSFAFAVFTVPGLLFLLYGVIDRVILHHHGNHKFAV